MAGRESGTSHQQRPSRGRTPRTPRRRRTPRREQRRTRPSPTGISTSSPSMQDRGHPAEVGTVDAWPTKTAPSRAEAAPAVTPMTAQASGGGRQRAGADAAIASPGRPAARSRPTASRRGRHRQQRQRARAAAPRPATSACISPTAPAPHSLVLRPWSATPSASAGDTARLSPDSVSTRVRVVGSSRRWPNPRATPRSTGSASARGSG